MQYMRISEGLTKYKLVPSTDNVYDYVKDYNKDYYKSIFLYNQSQFDQWKTTGSVAGISDVTTKSLVFDFDSVDVELSRQDALMLVGRLMGHGIRADNIQIAYSGSKGFAVEVDTNTDMNQEQFKAATFALASDLKTFDTKVNDSQRILRIVGTKHPKSGLFKFPLTVKQLSEYTVPQVKELASSLDNIDDTIFNSWTAIDMPDTITPLTVVAKKEKKLTELDNSDLDLSVKPKWLSDAKYALQQGFFEAGERNNAFVILAATYKSQGFPDVITYRILKGTAELQSNRTGQEAYSSKELWNNVVKPVYSTSWKGGTFSYDNTPLLQEITKRLGLKVEKIEEAPLVPVDNVTSIFRKFATDIDKNTIKLGIRKIDEEVRITTSMMVGLLAAPSAGKTSISLGILNAISQSGLKAAFFSLDMGAPLVYQRLIQKHTGLSGKKIFEMYKNKDPKTLELEQTVAKEYNNIRFSFKSGITVDDIRAQLLKMKEVDGEIPKLVVIDYLECIAGPFSDSTANTALIANQLKDLANELEICVFILLQPQKHAGDASAELLSMRQIKGSSVLEQACSIIFTLWRPGFSPKTPQEDRYASIAVVKNRMGSLGTYDFGFNGLTGQLAELDDYEKDELKEVRARRESEKAAAKADNF